MERLLTFQFGQPWWLLLLALIPLWAWLQGKRGTAHGVKFSSVGLFRRIAVLPRNNAGQWIKRVTLFSLILLILGMARPRIDQGGNPDQKEGIDIVLCMDISGSMEEKDFDYKGERISRAKALNIALSEFVANRPNDRFGIIGFAGGTYMVSPLTTDNAWIKHMLDFVKSDLYGTAIGEGIVASTQLLQEAKGKSKIILVATDGENNQGRAPVAGAEVARNANIRVHTLRIAPLRSVSADSSVKSQLSAVAEMTGGLYFQAADMNSMMEVYRQIDRMEKTKFDQKLYRFYDELFLWFIVPAALLILATWWGGNTIWSRLP